MAVFELDVLVSYFITKKRTKIRAEVFPALEVSKPNRSTLTRRPGFSLVKPQDVSVHRNHNLYILLSK